MIVTLVNFSHIEKRENHIFFNVTESSCCDDKRSESTSDNQVSAKFTFVPTFASSEIFHLSQLPGLFTLTRSQILEQLFPAQGSGW